MHNTSAESLTSAAPPACDTLQSRSPPVFCHSGHQIGRTAPSMHRPECLCHWQTVARTGRWDMETPEGQQKVRNKMRAERTCQCFYLCIKIQPINWKYRCVVHLWNVYLLSIYLGEIWRWVLPSAQVWKCPHCIPHHCETVLFGQQPAKEPVGEDKRDDNNWG